MINQKRKVSKEQFYQKTKFAYFVCRKCRNIIKLNIGKIVFDLENLNLVIEEFNEYHMKVPFECACGSKDFLRIDKDSANAVFEYRILFPNLDAVKQLEKGGE